MASTIDQLNLDMESIKKDMFKLAMKGEWDRVVEFYKEYPMARKVKLTRSGDTALHIAVSDGQKGKVQELVEYISSQPDRKAVLEIKNEQGSTPLHIAASMGNVAMSLYGKKEAFLCLHKLCGIENGYIYCRRKDGDTILHCTISGDYFDLAFRIIHMYEKLVNYVNDQGLSPLHILASKPSAFRSGSHIGGWYKLIYHCIFVDELEQEPSDYLTKSLNGQTIQNLETVFVDELEQESSDYLTKSLNGQTIQNLEIVFVDELEQEPSDYLTKSLNGQTIQNLEIVFVDELENEPSDHLPAIPEIIVGGEIKIEEKEPSDYPATGTKKSVHDQKKQKYPENYRTCVNFLQLFWTAVSVELNLVQKFTDAQNPKGSKDAHEAGFSATKGAQGRQLFPANYGICFEFVKLASKAMLVILGLGSTSIRKIEEKKKKHTWAVQILNELLHYTSIYEYEDTGSNPVTATVTSQTDVETKPYVLSDGSTVNFSGEAFFRDPPIDTLKTDKEDNKKKTGSNDRTKEAKEKPTEKAKKESPILIAAKNGITEIVANILELFPVAIHDMNEHKKNIVLLAVENRQPHVYELLLQKSRMKESVFLRVDDEGNSSLHLAAKLGEHKPWLIPGAALQMQWEIKWHEFVKESMPFHFFQRYNNKGNTSKEIFTETHKDLVKDGSEWLRSTSESCSVVAALIATVAFASATTVPGGVKQDIGTPTLENQPAFDAFAISSLVALCFSVTALVMFLSILTSRYQEKDFGGDLPRKLLLGLTSLFVSIASMLISFCAGHFFVLKDKLKYAAFPVYAVTCLPITFFAVAQFPLYFDLMWATIKKVPQRSYEVAPF
ncbi:hypothetical protein ACJW30_10G176300 [Castanea mollissima]